MREVIDRQTFIITANTFNMTSTGGANNIPSIVTLPMNLRFAADSLIIKQISYSPITAAQDVGDMLLIWCNLTNDGMIASIPNGASNMIPLTSHHADFFSLTNTFQYGNLVLQIQSGSYDPANGFNYSYNPGALISTQNPQQTFGILSLTVEFLRHARDNDGYQEYEY